MAEALAYSTLMFTVGLAVSRPRFGRGALRVTPGMAAVFGVVVLLASGLLHFADLLTSARIQWRPLLTVTCVMAMTGVVQEVGAFDRLARRLEVHARAAKAERVFDVVFVASVLTPSLLNNDAAILLLTPLVVALARRVYPKNERVLEALVFAVFLAPGVAPFVVSNPMNMIVADFAGIGFNAYARVMAPISIAGALVTYAVLRLTYRRVLAEATPAPGDVSVPDARPGERAAVALLLAVFLAYPVASALGRPVWLVAVLGAGASLVLARAYRVAPVERLARHVSPDILTFLWGVFLVVVGLRTVGVVDRLAALYDAHAAQHGSGVAVVGVTSALGSAIVDNHPMSVLNMMALGGRRDPSLLLAALVGGDIGPRLLPIGSLAGLLWMELLRRSGVRVSVVRFVVLGALVLAPTLAVSLWMLAAS